MTSRTTVRFSTTRSLASRILIGACLVGAAVASALTVAVSLGGLLAHGSTTAPTASSVVIVESMVDLANGTVPSPPVFPPRPADTAVWIAACVIALVLFAVVAVVAWRLLRRRPFARSLSITLIAAGCAVAASAIVVTIGSVGYSTNGLAPAFIVAGILLVVIGLVADRGARLQSETEGLV